MRHLIKLLFLLAAQSAGADVPASGQDLFLNGNGAEVLLLDGTLRLPAGRFACAGCHGKDARGDREGGTDFPAIDWPTLSAAGREQKQYSAASFATALRDGIAPDGRRLSDAMPRYIVTDQVMDSLVLYLRQIAVDQDRGIGPTTVFIGASPGSAGTTGLRLAAERFNLEGGAFGRVLELTTTGDIMMLDTELAAQLDPRIDQAEARLKAQWMQSQNAGAGTAGAVFTPTELLQSEASESADLHVVSLRRDILAPTQQRALPVPTLRPFLHGLILGDALIDCGRNVTRHCIESFFEKVDIDAYLAVYPRGN